MSLNVLFVCGSLNQTNMMHKIARHLEEHSCFFTPYYADGLIGQLSQTGLLDFTILGGRHRQNTESYLAREELTVDFGGRSRKYDLIVTCTDLLVQKNLRHSKVVLVQEGMTVPEGILYYLVRRFGMPRYLADTAATGLSDAYDIFCVASPGYKDLFIRKGVNPDKLVVTGIPNFDHAVSYLKNDFPQRDFILATTTRSGGDFLRERRRDFIHNVKRIAAGQKVIFKLHPNENIDLAQREIKNIIPEALIYSDGNVHHMIANCDALITEYSSVVYTALALGKKIYTAFDLDTVRNLTPMQNGGTSARNIASICEHLLAQPMRQARTPNQLMPRKIKPTAQASGQ